MRPQAARRKEPRRCCAPSPSEEAGQRIDNFLMRHFKSVPRSRVYRLLRKGEVRVNRKRVDAEYRMAAGDEVRLPPVRIDDARASPAGPRAAFRS